MDIIENIENDAEYKEAIEKRCKDKGSKCLLTLHKSGIEYKYIVLKGEKLVKGIKGIKACDCIIFIRDKFLIIGIVELKSKTVKVADIKKKLEDSSGKVMEILNKYNISHNECSVYHIILAEKWNAVAYKIVSTCKINMGGKMFSVIHDKCGKNFFEIISRCTTE
ncbi:MAG: hypothetical protein L3V56_01775 [Candidatus Magnetoovum sp. WYHC-5]|nr:hypothetical protein [Candidatus Magnetoovum sp. WYHC-5]